MSELVASGVDIDDPAYIEERNNRKLTADKIRQILVKVLDNPGDSSKRWIWELMQNAKDVPNKQFGRVSIQVELYHDKLVFKHNGDPFSLSNIFSLIQQVSSKDSSNADEEVTGKFGTGFISTHLLSDIIDVSGYVLHKGVYRKFETKLDRSGSTSEELLPKIDKALEHIRKIEDGSLFPIVYNYIENRNENSLDTVFTYYLSSEEKQKAAKLGLEDLINTLPLTLVNIEKIKSVKVINAITGQQDVYVSHIVGDQGAFKLFSVGITSTASTENPQQNFVTCKKDHVSVSVEVNNFHELKLKPIADNSPRLYRDFPLIGSYKFYLPYLLNGFKFNPTEDRDGILLHGTESREAIDNRLIVEQAFEAFKDLTQWIISNNAKNKYIAVLSRMPEENWQDYSKTWYVNLQSAYRRHLLYLPLVENNDGGNITIAEACIPVSGNSNESKKRFYNIVKDLKGNDKVPHADIILDWINYTGPKDELETWGIRVHYGLTDLLSEINFKSVAELRSVIKTDVDVVDWLNSLFDYIIEEKQADLFNQYSIIPNQTSLGQFRKLSELRLENEEEPIPDEFLDVLQFLTSDWRYDLIHRRVKLPTISIDKRGLAKVSETINSIIQVTERNPYGVYENSFLKRSNALEILVQILSCIDGSSTRQDFRSVIFDFGKNIFHFENNLRVVNNVAQFRFESSLELFIKLINRKIEVSATIDSLCTVLVKDFIQTTNWLNSYVNTLANKENFKQFLNSCNIIPNRYNTFCSFEELKSYGTQETPLDDKLLSILKDLDPKEDWRKEIVHECITILMKAPITFEVLGNRLQEVVHELQKEDTANPADKVLIKYRNPLLDLIEWCKNDIRAERYLQQMKSNSSELFYKLTLRDSNLGIDDIKLLSDKESIDLLKTISNTKVSKDELKRLIDLVDEIGSTDKLLEQAQRIKEEQENMNFLLQIGTQVEYAVKKALENENLAFKIDHQGYGSYDISVMNHNTGKQYFLELKSYLSGSNYPFRLSPSQADRASANPKNYALCMLERPYNNQIDDLYVKSKLVYRKQIGSLLAQGINDFQSYNQIRNRNLNTSRLHLVLLEQERIEVPKDLIICGALNFNSLIEDIKVNIN